MRNSPASKELISCQPYTHRATLSQDGNHSLNGEHLYVSITTRTIQMSLIPYLAVKPLSWSPHTHHILIILFFSTGSVFAFLSGVFKIPLYKRINRNGNCMKRECFMWMAKMDLDIIKICILISLLSSKTVNNTFNIS